MIIIAIGYENQFTCSIETTPASFHRDPSAFLNPRKVLEGFLFQQPISAEEIDELLVCLTPQEKAEFQNGNSLIQYSRVEEDF